MSKRNMKNCNLTRLRIIIIRERVKFILQGIARLVKLEGFAKFLTFELISNNEREFFEFELFETIQKASQQSQLDLVKSMFTLYQVSKYVAALFPNNW